MATKKRVTAKKYRGDDKSSWAVFVDGYAVMTGLTKSEVPYYRKQAEGKLAEAEAKKLGAKIVNLIPVGERELAAMHFTCENLGQPISKTLEGVKRAFDECVMAHESEGSDINDEYNDWKKEALTSSWLAGEWEKRKVKWSAAKEIGNAKKVG